MPGTGHPYEVLNIHDALAILERHAMTAGHPEGMAWLTGPGMLRFVTGEAFVTRVTGQDAIDAIPAGTDDRVRTILVAKANDGADLRVFVPGLLASGPDLPHLVDWLRALPRHDPRMLDKLPRVTVQAASLLADRWTTSVSRKAARRDRGPGLTKEVFPGMDGRQWVELLDQDALSDESARAGHCVADYGPMLKKGTRILSLRYAQDNPLVTLELVVREGVVSVGQVRTGRLLADQRFQRDVLVLLRGMHVQGDIHGEATACGLVMHEGRWESVTDVGVPMLLEGVPCLHVSGVVYVMAHDRSGSTVGFLSNPVLPALQVGDEPSSWLPIAVLDIRNRLGIQDQKAVARLANAPWRTGSVRSTDLLQVDGTWVPWREACVDVFLGGESCKVNPDRSRAFIMSHGGQDLDDVLVEIWQIARMQDHRGIRSIDLDASVVVHETTRRRWSATDVRRVACVLSVFRNAQILSGSSIVDAGLVNAHGRWVRHQDHVVHQACNLVGPLGTMRWEVTPWVTMLRHVLDDGHAFVAQVSTDRHGKVTDTVLHDSLVNHDFRLQVSQGMASKLGSMGLVPSAGMGVNRDVSRDRAGFPALVHDGQRWVSVPTADLAITMARSAHTGGMLTPSIVGLGLSAMENMSQLEVFPAFTQDMLEAWCIHASQEKHGVNLAAMATRLARLATFVGPRPSVQCLGMARKCIDGILAARKRHGSHMQYELDALRQAFAHHLEGKPDFRSSTFPMHPALRMW